MAAEDVTILKKNNSSVFVLKAAAGNEEFALRGEMLVGREDDCDITLNSGHISRHHSKINVSPGGVYIEDLQSTNGTYVNGNKIKGRVRLSVGDEVAFDDLLYKLCIQSNLRAEKNTASVQPESDPDDLIAKPFKPAANVEPIARHFKRPEEPVVPQEVPAELFEAPVRGAAQEPLAPVAPPAAVEEYENDDRTRFISPENMERFVDRNRIEREFNIGSGPRLIVTTAPLRGKLYELEGGLPGRQWRVGRDLDADIYLNDNTISMEHALLTQTDMGFELAVVEAKNGLLINGRAQTRAQLHHNDKLQIGRVELVFKTDHHQVVEDTGQVREKRQGRSRIAMIIMFLVLLFSIAAMFKTAS